MSVIEARSSSRLADILPPVLMGIVVILIFAGIAALAWTVNGAINRYHDRIALKGLNGKPKPIELSVGEERFEIPANLIRFPADRRGGLVTAADLLVLWPELDGYSDERAVEFRDASPSSPLVYVTLTEADVPVDAATRLASIYSRDFTGVPIPGPGHLVGRRMAEDSPYRGEIVFYQPQVEVPYVVRCLAEETEEIPATCIREVSIGHGLIMRYRFNWRLLGDWRTMDDRLVRMVNQFHRGG